MNQYTVVNNKGEILRSIACSPYIITANLKPGETAIRGKATARKHKIVDGIIVEKDAAEIAQYDYDKEHQVKEDHFKEKHKTAILIVKQKYPEVIDLLIESGLLTEKAKELKEDNHHV